MSSWFQACLPRIHLEEAYEPVGRCAPIDGMPKVSLVQVGSKAAEYLSQLTRVQIPADATLEDLMMHSEAFPRPFPVQTPLIRELLMQPSTTRNILCMHANSTYPLLLEGSLFLIIDFLEFKRVHGTNKERQLYENMGVTDIVHRLLEKRSVTFCGHRDRYLLLSGEKGYGGWEDVGTDKEKPPLLLKDCLSYDEMKLSSLLSVTSHTVFINEGHRKNRGIVSLEPDNVEKSGVIIGLIGPRLVQKDLNECQEVLVTIDQNTKENGYGSQSPEQQDNSKLLWRKIWAQFYGIKPNLPSFNEALKNFKASKRRVYQRFTELSDRELFDNLAYQKRIAVSAETLLLEAEHRAFIAGKTAFVHVVGIGLGVWRIADHQEKEFLSAFASCLNKLSPVLQHVSDIRFSWFREDRCGGVGNGGIIANSIKLHFDQSSPHVALDGEHVGKLLVVSYAWDMNALPGNEFWCGELGTSSDPAAACSTQVAELHNPHINRTKVCGTNLHIASVTWGVLHVAEYARRKLQQAAKRHSQTQKSEASEESTGNDMHLLAFACQTQKEQIADNQNGNQDCAEQLA